MLSIIPFRYLALLSGVLVAVLLVLSFNVGRATAVLSPPSGVSADAGFARDMQVHHAQAVEMSMLIRDRSASPEIRTMAYDIILTQQQQSGQMFAWLRAWGLPQTSTSVPMAWMHETVHEHGSGASASAEQADATMPGMASAADMDRLRNASGAAADKIFLTLMIAHHQGGVTMAEAAVQRATTENVRSFAAKMVAAQANETTAMQQMLAG